MGSNHNKEKFKSLVAINLLAWSAGGVFLYKNCNPAEEPLQTRRMEERLPASPAPAPTATSTSTSSTSTCTKDGCVFYLNKAPIPTDVKIHWLAQLALDFQDIRKRLGELESKDWPATLTYKDPEMDRLLRSFARLNEKAGRYGHQPIPVSGPTTHEIFRSLNGWLGRAPDAPLDEKAVADLDLKVVEAMMR